MSSPGTCAHPGVLHPPGGPSCTQMTSLGSCTHPKGPATSLGTYAHPRDPHPRCPQLHCLLLPQGWEWGRWGQARTALVLVGAVAAVADEVAELLCCAAAAVDDHRPTGEDSLSYRRDNGAENPTRTQARCPQQVTESTRGLQVTFVWAPRFGTPVGVALSSQQPSPLGWDPPTPHLHLCHHSPPALLLHTLGSPEPAGVGALTLHPVYHTPAPSLSSHFGGNRKIWAFSSPR